MGVSSIPSSVSAGYPWVLSASHCGVALRMRNCARSAAIMAVSLGCGATELRGGQGLSFSATARRMPPTREDARPANNQTRFACDL